MKSDCSLTRPPRLSLWLAKLTPVGLPPLGAMSLSARSAVISNGGIIVQTGGTFTNNGTDAVISGNPGVASSLSVDAGRLTNFSGMLRRRGCTQA